MESNFPDSSHGRLPLAHQGDHGHHAHRAQVGSFAIPHHHGCHPYREGQFFFDLSNLQSVALDESNFLHWKYLMPPVQGNVSGKGETQATFN